MKLVDQISTRLSSLIGLQTKRIGISVSGGVDSMALSYIVAEWSRKRNISVHAFVIDHGLRDGSAKEQDQVCENLKQLGLNPHKISVNLGGAAQVELVARDRRLNALAAYCDARRVPLVLFGHHKDDQYETFVMRKSMGSSWYGLAGMRTQGWLPGSTDIKTLRPLLDVQKHQLIALCREHRIPWFEDHTNKDTSLTLRNAIRKLREFEEILPSFLKSQYVWGMQSMYMHRRDKCDGEAAAVVRLDARLDYKTGSAEIDMTALDLSQDTVVSTVFKLVSFVTPISSKRVDYRRAAVVAFVGDFKKKVIADCVLEVKGGVLRINRSPLRTLKLRGSLQDIPKTLVYTATLEWSNWNLIDNRFWFRWRLPRSSAQKERRLAVFVVENKLRNEAVLQCKEAGIELKKKKNWQTQPLFAFLKDDGLEIVGFPTLDAHHGLHTQYRYKSMR